MPRRDIHLTSTSNHVSHDRSLQPSIQRPNSLRSCYGSGYDTPGYISPILSPSFRYANLDPASSCPTTLISQRSNESDVDNHDNVPGTTEEEIKNLRYSKVHDSFPCGHVLCHKCLRRVLSRMNSAWSTRCPVCHFPISWDDISLASMGIPTRQPACQLDCSEYDDLEPEISLLTNFSNIVKTFNGMQHNFRRLKEESVQSRSMSMTYINTDCHLCRESHPTLRIIQEHNKLAVNHERPNHSSNYYYRLLDGKVVSTFYSKVNYLTICVPCTYQRLQQSQGFQPINADLHSVPENISSSNHEMALVEVGKVVANNTTPISTLQGKHVIEVDHLVRVRERADQFDFNATAEQIRNIAQRQELSLLHFTENQIRDTGQLYHVTESNKQEYDNNETEV